MWGGGGGGGGVVGVGVGVGVGACVCGGRPETPQSCSAQYSQIIHPQVLHQNIVMYQTVSIVMSYFLCRKWMVCIPI